MTAKTKIIDRIADRVDLALDLLTLGQYGLAEVEQPAPGGAGCEGGERDCARREAFAPARPRGCDGSGRPAASQTTAWDF